MAKKANLFAKAATKAAETPKKPKGTVIELPKQLDPESGTLIGESRVLNEAVNQVIQADADKKAAENRGNLGKGVLGRFVITEWCRRFATDGVVPATPVTVINHAGQSLTYVVQDKSGQNPVSDEQISLLESILGPEAAARMVHEKTVYSFNPSVMGQVAAGSGAKTGEDAETVEEVVFDIVSRAIMSSDKLSDEQKDGLIAAKTARYMRGNTLPQLAVVCGADAPRIQAVVEAAGSAWVRYLKT